jgi:hypothetical protein
MRGRAQEVDWLDHGGKATENMVTENSVVHRTANNTLPVHGACPPPTISIFVIALAAI